MSRPNPPPALLKATERRSAAFLLLYALAYAGGVIGYLPLLSFLLPLKVERIAGASRLDVLTACLMAGAVAASLSNILFGWASDRTRDRGIGRRAWVIAGLAATGLAYAGLAIATSSIAILIAVVAFQIAINMALAPLGAIMAEEVPDAQKGVAGGLLALGSPIAGAVSAMVLRVDGLGEPAQFAAVVLTVAACIAPLLMIRPRRIAEPPITRVARQALGRDLLAASAARILVQVAGAVLSLYLLYYFEILAGGPRPGLAAHVSHVLTIAYLVPVPLAILIGRWSDRAGRRKPFLIAMAAFASSGLIAMALATDPAMGAWAYGAYTVGSAIFLALHAGFAMQLLPNPRHRGRDLGLLNLTNTLPSFAGPFVTWMLATPQDFTPALVVLAGLTIGGGLLVLAIGGRR